MVEADIKADMGKIEPFWHCPNCHCFFDKDGLVPSPLYPDKEADMSLREKIARAIAAGHGRDPDELVGRPLGDGDWEPCLLWELQLAGADKVLNILTPLSPLGENR